MSMQHHMRMAFIFSVVAAYLLMLLQLPTALAPWKPSWLALVLIYWGLEEPGHVTLGRAFVLGLIADILTGNLLGEQALRLVALAFIVARFRLRLRFFPMWQQALAVGVLLLNDRVLLLMVRTFAGKPWPPLEYWFAPLAGAVLWPLLFLLLDDVRARARAHE